MFTDLFNNLMALCSNPDTGFYFVDRVYDQDNHLYRIFSYRATGSYTSWLLPDALNCRGTMFRQESSKWILVSLPMPKCFRLRENPIIQHQESHMDELDFFIKLDGSLISTFVDANNNIGVKSTTSLSSPHCSIARGLLPDILNEHNISVDDCRTKTYNFELCSSDPKLRIVVKYDSTKLTLINSRSHVTGRVHHNAALLMYQHTSIPTIESHLKVRTDIEGVIGYDYRNDVTFKMKTKWYDELHTSKSSFNYENVINLYLMEKLDDYRSLHYDNVGLIGKIEKIVTFIHPLYNKTMDAIEKFFNCNKHLQRKEFACLIQSTFCDSIYLNILMQMYSGKISNESKFKALSKFLIEQYSLHGVKDNGFTNLPQMCS